MICRHIKFKKHWSNSKQIKPRSKASSVDLSASGTSMVGSSLPTEIVNIFKNKLISTCPIPKPNLPQFSFPQLTSSFWLLRPCNWIILLSFVSDPMCLYLLKSSRIWPLLTTSIATTLGQTTIISCQDYSKSQNRALPCLLSIFTCWSELSA